MKPAKGLNMEMTIDELIERLTELRKECGGWVKVQMIHSSLACGASVSPVREVSLGKNSIAVHVVKIR